MDALEVYKMNKKQVIAKLVEICQHKEISYDLVEMQNAELHGLRIVLYSFLTEGE